MSGFTANLSSLPPGVSHADIERQFGERIHEPQCPQHDGWKPDLDNLLGVAREAVTVWDETHEWTAANEARLANAIEDLRSVLEPRCACDQLASAYAEDAAEHAAQEDEGR